MKKDVVNPGKIYSVANYIVDLTNRYNESVDFNSRIPLSCRRLQNLLFLFEIEYKLRTNGKKCLDKQFYAWPGGPTIPVVYGRYAQFQTGEMITIEDGYDSPITEDEKFIALKIFEDTVGISTSIISKACKQGPWQDVFDPNDPEHKHVITDDEVFKYWSSVCPSLKFSDEEQLEM